MSHYTALIRLGTYERRCTCAHATPGEAARCLTVETLIVFGAVGAIERVTESGREVVVEVVVRRAGVEGTLAADGGKG